MRFPVKITRRCICGWNKEDTESQTEWVQTSSETRRAQERHCSSCSEVKPLHQLHGMVPQSKDEPKCSGRGGLWRPSRPETPPRTWASTAAFSFLWSGTQSWTHPTHLPLIPPSFTIFIFFIMFSKQYVYSTWLSLLCFLLLIMHAYLWIITCFSFGKQ